MFKSSFYPNKLVYFAIMGHFVAAGILAILLTVNSFVLPITPLYISFGYFGWVASLLTMGSILVYYFHLSVNKIRKSNEET